MPLPARKLSERPDLRQIKRQAKELLDAFRVGDDTAVREVQAHYTGADPATFSLHDAQLVIARACGFESWPKLKAYVDGVNGQNLIAAVQAGDMRRVEAMLDARPELVNTQVSYGDERRPIHFAVLNRSTPMVRMLMQRGANAHHGVHPHRAATTAYRMAVERDYQEIAAIIEQEEQRRREAASSPANAVTGLEEAVNEAIFDGDSEAALALLEANRSLVNAADRNGWTPLHAAAATRNAEVAAWLIEHGSDPQRKLGDGRTPLDLAAGSRTGGASFADIAKLFEGGALTTARAAVAAGDEEWLRRHHAEGSLSNSVRWDSGGLLTIAVRNNQPKILKMLLEFGFDPDERVSFGEGAGIRYSQGQPLWQAAALGRRDLVEILLSHGADPNAHVDSSGTPVYSAFGRRHMEIVELLRAHGGVVGADTAAIYRQTELARQMMADDERGVLSPHAVSPNRTLAIEFLDFGNSGGDPEIVRMALEKIDWPASDPRWFFFLARSLDFWNHIPWLSSAHQELDRTTYIQCFRQVLRRCDPNLRGGFGRTALHEVAAMGDHVTDDEAAPFAEALLDAGARTDIRDQLFASTALGWACRWGRMGVARVLLERGADARELEGEPWARPLAWAEKMGHGEIADLVRRHGG